MRHKPAKPNCCRRRSITAARWWRYRRANLKWAMTITRRTNARPESLSSYYIDKYEVTNAQYKKFCDETGKAYPPNFQFNPNYFTDKPDNPVLGVPFEEALAYASWRANGTRRNKSGRRLPPGTRSLKGSAVPLGRRISAGSSKHATGDPVPVTEPTGDLSFYSVLHMGRRRRGGRTPYKPYEGNNAPDANYKKDGRVMRGGTFFRASKPNEARTSYRNYFPRVSLKILKRRSVFAALWPRTIPESSRSCERVVSE